MSDLDDKLRELLGAIELVVYVQNGVSTWNEKGEKTTGTAKQTTYLRAYGEKPINKAIPQIKQAFADEGYISATALLEASKLLYKQADVLNAMVITATSLPPVKTEVTDLQLNSPDTTKKGNPKAQA